MNITFYNNLEFIEKRNTYHLAEGQIKGTYYAKIINNIGLIISWLEEFLELLENNTTDEIVFPICKSIDADILYIIKKEITADFDADKKSLIWKKEYHKLLEEKEKKEKVNKSNSIWGISKSEIDRIERRIKNKKSPKFNTRNIINFLINHLRKVDYFIIKEQVFKQNVSKKEIEAFFFYSIDLPAYTREMYFEEDGALKSINAFFLDCLELTEKEQDKKIDNFLKNTDFKYTEKYDIYKISELLNLYFNNIINNKIGLKKCKNCEKYFITHNRQIYCDNPSPQNSNITCRKLSDDMKEKEDKLYEIYRKTYKTQHNKLKRYIDVGNIPEDKLKERFKKWNDLALQKKKKSKTVEEYTKWYKTSLNWLEDFK